MSLASIYAETKASAVKTCRLGQIRAELTPDDQAWLDKTMASDEFSSVIANVLTRAGHKIGQGVVRVHRSGACCCGAR